MTRPLDTATAGRGASRAPMTSCCPDVLVTSCGLSPRNLPHSCAGHRNLATARLRGERPLPQDRVSRSADALRWIPVTSTGMRGRYYDMPQEQTERRRLYRGRRREGTAEIARRKRKRPGFPGRSETQIEPRLRWSWRKQLPCRTCGSRSPIRCRTRRARGRNCLPGPWSGRRRRSTSGCRG